MKISPIFSDNMILQANKPVYVFGSGAGTVVIQIGGKSASLVSTGETWELVLPSFDYGGPYEMQVTLDGAMQTLQDIYFGDVYILGGQSNIELSLRHTNTPKEYYRDNDSLRIYTVDSDSWKIGAKKKLNGVTSEDYIPKDRWLKAAADTVGLWSALGYLVGQELGKCTDHKIGMVACFHGASPIQSWLPAHFLDNTPYFVPLENRSSGAREPSYSTFNGDGMLYNGMLKTILPFAAKAVIWYQGESNANGDDSKRDTYAGLLKLLIGKWRDDFKDAQLPFIVIQIHDYIYGTNGEISGWMDVQAAQEDVCNEVAGTYLVKSADVCETADIHPASKIPLALRIAAAVKEL